VNNAALPLTTALSGSREEEWRQALDVNLTAPFLLMHAVLPAHEGPEIRPHRQHLLHAREMVSTLGGAHYTTSKTGLLGLDARGGERARQCNGITVNACVQA
jgi:NAD(P)-dependent dehydrogenase (short-subunit alcohol dehydrogenase family)